MPLYQQPPQGQLQQQPPGQLHQQPQQGQRKARQHSRPPALSFAAPQALPQVTPVNQDPVPSQDPFPAEHIVQARIASLPATPSKIHRWTRGEIQTAQHMHGGRGGLSPRVSEAARLLDELDRLEGELDRLGMYGARLKQLTLTAAGDGRPRQQLQAIWGLQTRIQDALVQHCGVLRKAGLGWAVGPGTGVDFWGSWAQLC
ncbi:hypothetical protein QBC39DRAFT_361632 [Podospora conica]|nr:hypothetical protein QBC39DRAFT_361632 [Schizothecium conicum]